LLPTLGSAGDVNPVIGLGLALQSRGHRATVLTTPYFADLIERQGLGFLPVGTLVDAQQALSYAHLWHPRKGAEHILRMMIEPIRQIYHLIEAHADSDTVIAASGISLGARVAQEHLGVPMASVHLQPSLIRSSIDQGKVLNLRIAAWQPGSQCGSSACFTGWQTARCWIASLPPHSTSFVRRWACHR
jgi:rhamnosyltransferase subunit B